MILFIEVKKCIFTLLPYMMLVSCAVSVNDSALHQEKRVNHSSTREETLHLAELGNIEAQIEMGRIYLYGEGDIAPDNQRAFEMYMKAAKQNSVEAFYYLGNLYSTGMGTRKNDEEAKFWYLKAALNDHRLSYIPLAQVIYKIAKNERDMCESLYWYKRHYQTESENMADIFIFLKEKLSDKECDEYKIKYRSHNDVPPK